MAPALEFSLQMTRLESSQISSAFVLAEILDRHRGIIFIFIIKKMFTGSKCQKTEALQMIQYCAFSVSAFDVLASASSSAEISVKSPRFFFSLLKKVFSGSKHPKNILLKFENRRTDLGSIWLDCSLQMTRLESSRKSYVPLTSLSQD